MLPKIKSLRLGDLVISEDILVLEYSLSQKAFHSQSLVDALQSNLNAFLMQNPGDFVMIGIFPDRESLDRFCSSLQPYLADRPEMSEVTIDDLLRFMSPH